MKTTFFNTKTKEASAFREWKTGWYTVNGKPGKLPDGFVELEVITSSLPAGKVFISEEWLPDVKNKQYRQIIHWREKTREEIIAEFNQIQAAKDAEIDALKVKEVLRGLSVEKEFMIHYKAEETLQTGDKRLYNGEILTATKEHMTDIQPDSRNYELQTIEVKR